MSKLRRRLEERRASQAAAFASAVEVGHVMFSNPAEYRQYLMENGATAEEAASIVAARRSGQVDGALTLKPSAKKQRRDPLSDDHPWRQQGSITPRETDRPKW